MLSGSCGPWPARARDYAGLDRVRRPGCQPSGGGCWRTALRRPRSPAERADRVRLRAPRRQGLPWRPGRSPPWLRGTPGRRPARLTLATPRPRQHRGSAAGRRAPRIWCRRPRDSRASQIVSRHRPRRRISGWSRCRRTNASTKSRPPLRGSMPPTPQPVARVAGNLGISESCPRRGSARGLERCRSRLPPWRHGEVRQSTPDPRPRCKVP